LLSHTFSRSDKSRWLCGQPATGEQDLVLMSEQSEIALGRKTGKEVLQHLNGLYPQGKANSKPLLKIVNQSDQDLSISVKNSVS